MRLYLKLIEGCNPKNIQPETNYQQIANNHSLPNNIPTRIQCFHAPREIPHILRISHPLTNRRIVSSRLLLIISNLFLTVRPFTIFFQIVAFPAIHHIMHHLEPEFYMMSKDFYI